MSPRPSEMLDLASISIEEFEFGFVVGALSYWALVTETKLSLC